MLIDENSSANRRMNLAEQVKTDIAERNLPPGTQIRPIRSLAEQYGVSYATMRRVLLRLQDEGVVALQHGSGVYVAGEAPAAREGTETQTDAPRLLIIVPEWVTDRGQGVVQCITAELLSPAYHNRWRTEILLAAGKHDSGKGFYEEVLWRQPDGIAWIRPYVEYRHHLLRLADRGIPLCACGRRFQDASYPTYRVDLASAAEEVVQWCADHGRKRIAVLANLIADSFQDDYAAEAVHELLQAAERRGLHIDPEDIYSLPIPRRPQTIEAFSDFVRKRADADVYICLFQHYLPVLANLAREGVFSDPASVAVVDYYHHYVPAREMPATLEGMTFLQLQYDPAHEGRAMVRFFENLWMQTESQDATGIPVRLEKVPFPGRPA